jgi:hypothetical protein
MIAMIEYIIQSLTRPLMSYDASMSSKASLCSVLHEINYNK